MKKYRVVTYSDVYNNNTCQHETVTSAKGYVKLNLTRKNLAKLANQYQENVVLYDKTRLSIAEVRVQPGVGYEIIFYHGWNKAEVFHTDFNGKLNHNSFRRGVHIPC
jgi:hypothetical protein